MSVKRIKKIASKLWSTLSTMLWWHFMSKILYTTLRANPFYIVSKNKMVCSNEWSKKQKKKRNRFSVHLKCHESFRLIKIDLCCGFKSEISTRMDERFRMINIEIWNVFLHLMECWNHYYKSTYTHTQCFVVCHVLDVMQAQKNRHRRNFFLFSLSISLWLSLSRLNPFFGCKWNQNRL